MQMEEGIWWVGVTPVLGHFHFAAMKLKNFKDYYLSIGAEKYS